MTGIWARTPLRIKLVAALCALFFDFRLPIGAVQIQLTVPLLIAFLIWCWRELQRAEPEFGLANAFSVRALITNSGHPLRTS